MNIFKYLVQVLGLALILHGASTPAHAGLGSSCTRIIKSLISNDSHQLTQTFGVEMELRHPENMSSWDVARKLSEFFKDKGFQNIELKRTSPVSDDDFIITYTHNGKTQQWSFPEEPDFYWGPDKKYPGFELTTPIMTSDEDLTLLSQVLGHLKSLGITPAKSVGGTHVHWGVGQLTYQNIARIFRGYLKAYDQLEVFFEPEQSRTSIGTHLIEETLRKLQQARNYTQLVNDDVTSGEYFYNGPIKYNFEHQTMETRLFNSTTDAEEIAFNIKFSRAFILKILNDDDFYQNLEHLNAQQILQQLKLQ